MESATPRKKVYRTKEQKLALIQEQAVSGLTVKEFCKNHRFFVTQFYTWKKAVQESQSTLNSSSSFVELKAPSFSHNLELTFPNGIRLTTSDPAMVSTLILKTILQAQ